MFDDDFGREWIAAAMSAIPEPVPVISDAERQICLDATPADMLISNRDEANLMDWLREPGDDILRYRYLVRSGSPAAVGLHGRKWPENGYVHCRKWSFSRVRKTPAYWRVLDLSETTRDNECGLYGFLDGRIGGRYFDEAGELGSTVQIIKVDLAELEQSYDFWEHRAPRGWVKFNGSIEEALEFLQEEGTPYSLLVAANVKIGLLAMRKMLLQPNNEELFYEAFDGRWFE